MFEPEELEVSDGVELAKNAYDFGKRSNSGRSATYLSPLFLMWSYLVKCGRSWSFVVTELLT